MPNDLTPQPEKELPTEAEVAAALAYDPFAEDGEKEEPADEPEENSSEGGEEAAPSEGQGEAPEPEKTPEPESAKEEEAPQLSETQQLAAQIAALQQQNQNLMARMNKPAEPTKEEKKEGAGDEPAFAYQMPPQLVAGLRSEDPNEASQALTMLVQGIGKNVYKEVMERATKMVDSRVGEVNTQLQSKEQQTIHDDYYGKFPTHDNPAIKPIVAMMTQQVVQLATAQAAASGTELKYGPAIRDAIGAKVNEWLKGQATPAPAAKPTSQTPTFKGTEKKLGKEAKADPNSPDDIAKTLFG